MSRKFLAGTTRKSESHVLGGGMTVMSRGKENEWEEISLKSQVLLNLHEQIVYF